MNKIRNKKIPDVAIALFCLLIAFGFLWWAALLFNSPGSCNSIGGKLVIVMGPICTAFGAKYTSIVPLFISLVMFFGAYITSKK